jgi:hypothetical protein
MAKRSSSNLPVPVSSAGGWELPVDPVTGLGLLAAVGFAGFIGGPMWLGLGVAIAAVVVNLLVRQQHHMAYSQQAQENLAHHMLRGATPEDLADLMLAGEVAEKNTFDFLQAIKQEYGGESVDLTDHRRVGTEQLDPVSPGITLTVSHDLGLWWAQIKFTGATGKRYYPAGMAVWKARGKTPQEAVDAVIKRCAQARQQMMIQEYASRMVAEND